MHFKSNPKKRAVKSSRQDGSGITLKEGSAGKRKRLAQHRAYRHGPTKIKNKRDIKTPRKVDEKTLSSLSGTPVHRVELCAVVEV